MLYCKLLYSTVLFCSKLVHYTATFTESFSPSYRSRSPSHWSSCSHEYLALSFERSMDYCLRNKPKSLFQSPICGNSFVEEGEQCDCGLPEHCNNPCCDPHTCTLYANATCATGHCCDLKVSVW